MPVKPSVLTHFANLFVPAETPINQALGWSVTDSPAI
jgi:hypothetical protein